MVYKGSLQTTTGGRGRPVGNASISTSVTGSSSQTLRSSGGDGSRTVTSSSQPTTTPGIIQAIKNAPNSPLAPTPTLPEFYANRRAATGGGSVTPSNPAASESYTSAANFQKASGEKVYVPPATFSRAPPVKSTTTKRNGYFSEEAFSKRIDYAGRREKEVGTLQKDINEKLFLNPTTDTGAIMATGKAAGRVITGIPFLPLTLAVGAGKGALAVEGLIIPSTRQNTLRELKSVPSNYEFTRQFNPYGVNPATGKREYSPEAVINIATIGAGGFFTGKGMSAKSSFDSAPKTILGSFTEKNNGIFTSGEIKGTVKIGGKKPSEIPFTRSYSYEGSSSTNAGFASDFPISGQGKTTVGAKAFTDQFNGKFTTTKATETSQVGVLDVKAITQSSNKPRGVMTRDIIDINSRGFSGGTFRQGVFNKNIPQSNFIGTIGRRNILIESSSAKPPIISFKNPSFFPNRKGQIIPGSRGFGSSFDNSFTGGTGGTGGNFNGFFIEQAKQKPAVIAERPAATPRPASKPFVLGQQQLNFGGMTAINSVRPSAPVIFFPTAQSQARSAPKNDIFTLFKSAPRAPPSPGAIILNPSRSTLNPFAIPITKSSTQIGGGTRGGIRARSEPGVFDPTQTTPDITPEIGITVIPDIFVPVDTRPRPSRPSPPPPGIVGPGIGPEIPPFIGFPKLGAPNFGIGGGGRVGGGGRRQSFSYTPSLTATLFNIRGRRPSNPLGGFELRPIEGTARRKRR